MEQKDKSISDIINELILATIRGSGEFSITCAELNNEKNQFITYPSQVAVQETMKKLEEFSTKGYGLLDDVSKLYTKGNFINHFLNYLKFIKNNLLTLYTDKSENITLLSISNANHIINYFKALDGKFYFIFSSAENRSNIDHVDYDKRITGFSRRKTVLFEITDSLGDDLQINDKSTEYVERIYTNYYALNPGIYSRGREIIISKSNPEKIEINVTFETCSFTINHSSRKLTKIVCKI